MIAVQPRRLAGRRPESGSATVETMLGVSAVIAIFGLLVLAGLVTMAANRVEQAAADAARAASVSRDPETATRAARETASMSLDDQGTTTCESTTINVDTSGFHAPAGQHATVTVTITCPIRVLGLAVPGVTSRTAVGVGTSPIDTYRQAM